MALSPGLEMDNLMMDTTSPAVCFVPHLDHLQRRGWKVGFLATFLVLVVQTLMFMGVLTNGPYTKKTVTICMTANTQGPHDFAWNPELPLHVLALVTAFPHSMKITSKDLRA